jgi:hypothetical protein
VVHTQPWTTRRFHNKYATLFGSMKIMEPPKDPFFLWRLGWSMKKLWTNSNSI